MRGFSWAPIEPERSTGLRFASFSCLVARLNNDWDGDVRAFDDVYNHILMMSDALADGIVKQDPERFGGASPTATSGSKY